MKKIVMFLCVAMMCSFSLVSTAQQESEQKEEANTEAQKTEQESKQKEDATTETETATSDEQDESLPTREELGDWWEVSSLKYDPVYPKWLFHFQGSFSYTKLSGNIDGDYYGSGVDLALRKKRFTNYLNYSLAQSTTTSAVDGARITSDQENLINRLQFDWLKRLAIQLGATWERDTNFYVQNRYTLFLGPTLTVVDTARHLLKVGSYYGYENTEYTNQKLNELGLPSADDLKTDGLFVDQKYRWFVLPGVSLDQYFAYLFRFDDDNSYRWLFDAKLNLKIKEPFGLFINYNIKQEENPLLEVVKTIGAKKRDTRLTVGISLTY